MKIPELILASPPLEGCALLVVEELLDRYLLMGKLAMDERVVEGDPTFALFPDNDPTVVPIVCLPRIILAVHRAGIKIRHISVRRKCILNGRMVLTLPCLDLAQDIAIPDKKLFRPFLLNLLDALGELIRSTLHGNVPPLGPRIIEQRNQRETVGLEDSVVLEVVAEVLDSPYFLTDQVLAGGVKAFKEILPPSVPIAEVFAPGVQMGARVGISIVDSVVVLR